MVTTAARAGTGAVGIVPMAFIGRTSTVQMQDPVESLAKQLRLSRERLPEGFVITRYYWDVESGGTDLDAAARPARGAGSPPPASPATAGWPSCAPRSSPAAWRSRG
jgi:hypothetical protein